MEKDYVQHWMYGELGSVQDILKGRLGIHQNGGRGGRDSLGYDVTASVIPQAIDTPLDKAILLT